MSRTDLPDTPIVLARAGGKVLLKAEDRIIGTLSGLAPEDPHGADLTDFRMVVWHRASARQRLVTDGEAMKSPKSAPKSYKRIIELPQPGSAAKWTPEGGAGWYVVQEREQDDSADLVRTPLAGPFRTRTEAEARLVGTV